MTTKTPPLTDSLSGWGRDKRKAIVEQIEGRTGRQLLCYIANEAPINAEDVLFFQELLYPLEPNARVDLLLHSNGGDVATAEKLVHMIWDVTWPSGEFRVIVPDRAKSAATLLALGANVIIMSSASELGPIDPQVELNDTNSSRVQHSVFDYLDAFQAAQRAYQENPNDPAAKSMFDRFDPVRLMQFEQLKNYVRQCAENLLKRHGGNFTLAPSKLMNTTVFPSHGQMIGWETARGEIGLDVEFVESRDETWRSYWRLYCYQRLAGEGKRKVFESRDVSLIV